MADTTREPSSPIYRCRSCGALVHPADTGAEPLVSWCQRCRGYVETERDGGVGAAR
ncbi:MAG: hypothetical protein ACRDZQ_09960 [Acidimicrobiales bacterium]